MEIWSKIGNFEKMELWGGKLEILGENWKSLEMIWKFGKYQEIWKAMGNVGKMLKSVQKNWKLAEKIANLGKIWKFLGKFRNLGENL